MPSPGWECQIKLHNKNIASVDSLFTCYLQKNMSNNKIYSCVKNSYGHITNVFKLPDKM